MKILVTGRDGQVARSLAERGAGLAGVELVFAARPDCDLAEPGSAAAYVATVKPDLVVNAAAYTAVDKAETEEALAYRVNAEGAGEVAAAAAAVGAPVIHLSTDYVYDGSGDAPLTEDRAIAPLGAYGRTKASGEDQVRTANPDHLILRTAWVHSPFGHNFVKTMLRLSAERDELSVVADQRGSPTSALDLAGVILALAERRLGGDARGWGETYHAAGAGEASWAEFAAEIMRQAGATIQIRPIATADYPTPARRPAWSVLSGAKLRGAFGIGLGDWEEALLPVVARLVGER
ncbi:dTDP-4-dehydrorhamnose reductase [Sphingomonas astaxanthinifaciens]|uniref:dTDP-4-dehydrorhamnose reductase n=1 Tax=Sphingomonas astaxanthinifaciens DSM 22298 TaxID=1123267 RepID=A0ABQ5Z2I5_9SPHN|nr:dTDP-4-dehydrorhamnose reductase [Sphingomonas astaxanthinifaciens]GLR46975.1 NAD(P)-dependent oxidoreductase [Sphingomonas astaxanthinifaciens DSM 22298]